MWQSPHTHYFFNTKGEIQGRGLRQDRKTLGPLRALEVAQDLLVQPDLPPSRSQVPAQRGQQCAFTRAIGTQHAQHFTRTYIKSDIRLHDFPVTTDLQILRTQHQWRPRNSK